MRSFWLGAFISFVVPASAEAQNASSRALNLARLPTTGSRPAAFVPAGWRLVTQLAADINADQRPDQVLVLEEKAVPGLEGSGDERALVVILARPGGTWERVGASNQVVYCKSCYGMLGNGAEGGLPEMQVKKGVLILDQLSGSRESVYRVLRFRYEAATNRMRLIGEDVTESDRLEGSSVATSTNLLTGVQEITSVRPDPKDETGERQLTSVRRRTLHTKPQRYLEDYRRAETWQ